MNASMTIDTSASSRDLIRKLRVGVSASDGEVLPESIAWQVFVELRRRGDPNADNLFIGALKNLHSRRCIAGVDLPNADALPDEHRMVEDAFLADLWKAYKKCIRTNRTGPASQLLRDIEEQIAK